MSCMLSSIIFKARLSESFRWCQAESFLPMKARARDGDLLASLGAVAGH